MVTATMVFARLGPSTATTRMASTRLGTAMMRSITREATTSITPPKNAAARPIAIPSTNDTLITARPMKSEMRAPWMSRDSMSRPRPSVPRMKRHDPPSAHTGAARTASRNCSFGGYGAITSARIATATISVTTARPKTAPRFSRNALQKARQGVSAAFCASAGSRVSTAMANPRIDDAVQDVDAEVHEDDDRRDEHDAALQRRIIAAPDRLD